MSKREQLGPQTGMGVMDFEENHPIIAEKFNKPLTVKEEFGRASMHPYYHGYDRPGCCLVKKRRERVNTYNDTSHYIDIYTCLTCGDECLRSGWRLGWYLGTNSREL